MPGSRDARAAKGNAGPRAGLASAVRASARRRAGGPGHHPLQQPQLCRQAHPAQVVARHHGLARSGGDQVSDPNADWTSQAGTTFVGPCTVGAELGSEWSRVEGETTSTGCVTQDGIILRATTNGQTTWETTSISRGPQDAALFTMPAGVQVMDLNNLGGNLRIPGQ